MRRFLVCLAAAVALPAPARADELAEALRMLQQRYESTRTLVAKFSQEVESPTLAGKLTSSGTLNFEKPNRMRWDYAPPERQTILSDGDTLWIYQPDEKQVAPRGLPGDDAGHLPRGARTRRPRFHSHARVEREGPLGDSPGAARGPRRRHARAGGAQARRGHRGGAHHRSARHHDAARAHRRAAERPARRRSVPIHAAARG
ncbi:MAG: outer membrane lipoprotein carrier protein LolA [Deltaproteobacteria bacterium]|nr:MAG: outer membrane lipoprotein carrier protein LolA [Deltaproteobacteria bacterium]